MSLGIAGGGHSLGVQALGGTDDDAEEKKKCTSAFSLVDRYANEFKAEQERLKAIEEQKVREKQLEKKRKDKLKRADQWCWATMSDGVKWAFGVRVSERLFGM
eukprot:TRINITY_DN6466_c0_g1_i1.p1 TRINITY_DN6466_c0_g1~~TRINITY_DN6466_c0_g1_i1.p1  ORF type:complete len:103 (+),score=24.77 TRINITY_DN6466_c0_g1_i1:30-338(+)